jgi:hypothetical protein
MRQAARGFALAAGVLLAARAARGYVEAGYTLGRLIGESTNVVLVRVEKLDRERNLIIYHKVRDIKGTHPGDAINHEIGKRGFHPREWQTIMNWVEVGKAALVFHNGGASETCIDNYWYQCSGGQWWGMTHAEPYMLRTFAGKPERLAALVAAMLAGQEVVVPCMVDGDKNALQLRSARIQRMRASLKVLDYDPKRDFVGWGVEEFRAITGMPGFTHYAPLLRTGPGAGGVAAADLDGDGRADFCLFGAAGVALLHSSDGSFDEVTLAAGAVARDAAWGDFDGDGLPDLLLATPDGPRLFRNEGKSSFQDCSAALPRQAYYHLTAAAWLDYDGDGRADILLADGFRGLRLFRNKGAKPPDPHQPTAGAWYYIGPFEYYGGRGFKMAYPPEREIDLSKQYPGKARRKVAWKRGDFPDGRVNSLALFDPQLNQNSVVYLYRELDFGRAIELPVSLGSDDTLTVWLNGEQLLAEDAQRSCEPDQAQLTLKLKPGRNRLLIKVCNGSGEFALYFSPRRQVPYVAELFEDVSDAVGLGEGGVAGKLKGDRLAVADVNGDKRPDILYSAGSGVLALHTPRGFVAAADCGISYRAGGVAPAFGDYDGDGDSDLFVPQPGRCKLFRNDGKGRFTDVTASAGALAELAGHATCAAWADFNNTGRADLFVGCLNGPNRYFRNVGGGRFADAGGEIGLYRRIFNTQGVGVVDINKDGVLDVIFNNEGQPSAVLLGDPQRLSVLAARPNGARQNHTE